ncbi:biotin--[acetyl-CoA-carboxylase] ligase [Treponema denticola]|uniref:biotin--[acetyl-CoA-carboxylase] ligase n=1 Tax=Treponema denticola TaxID=158 RepID=UPI002107E3D9|nr:biotin--[acetyl-CoA-carboxylase] ligase [Treponema denticola]UTY23134.1 biotin--[acetyl-CoA-carboxylase] ligase [Treponema denticola]
MGELISRTTSNILLDMLIEQNGRPLSGEEAALHLGLSRVSVWKAVQKLRDEGYEIEGGKNKGYILKSSSDVLNAFSIEKNLSAFAQSVCKGKVEVFKTIDSTNTEAKRRLTSSSRAESLHGTVLFAEHQSAGRGRFSRSFYSPRGAGLYFSLIFCPSIPAKTEKEVPASALYTAISAVIICRCLKVLGFAPQIKWVNDIYLNGKKICGILSEGIIDMETSSVQAVIIGIGLNVKESNFPPELKNKAGSLFTEAGSSFSEAEAPSLNRNVLASSIISSLIESLYGLHSQENLMEEYKSLSLLTGKKVRVLPFAGIPYQALVLGISDLGHLIIETDDGKKNELISGEVSLGLEP